MKFIIELLKNNEVFPFIITTVAVIAYVVLTLFRDRWFSKIPFLRAIFRPRIAGLGMMAVLIWVAGIYSDRDRILKEVRYNCISEEIRNTAIKISEGRTEENFYELPTQMTVNLSDLKKDFKAIAFMNEHNEKGLELDSRLNDELKKHGQYSDNPEDLDYVVCYYKNWKSDSYYGNGGVAFCRTENAFVVFVDFKRQEIVDTVNILINRNPESLTTTQFGSENIELSEEEVYQFVFGYNRNH